jgi:pilus assembly protein Flp/PilA
MLNFLRDECGASAAEYALMLAVISAGVAAASMGLSGSIANAIDRARGQLAIAGAAGDETPAAVASSGGNSSEGGSGPGNNGKGAANGHGKSNGGQGNAYGKTK